MLFVVGILGHDWQVFLPLSVAAAGAVWIYDRWDKMDPATVTLVGVVGGWVFMTVALAGVVWNFNTARPQRLPEAPAPASRPVLLLVAPKERYILAWKKGKVMPNLRPESQPFQEGYNPGVGFVVSNTGTGVAQDITIKWQVETLGIKDVINSSERFRDYEFEITGDQYRFTPKDGSGGHKGSIAPQGKNELDIVTDEKEFLVPYEVLNQFMFYAVALLPEERGAWLDFTYDVNIIWKSPPGGHARFRVKATAFNAKPEGGSSANVAAFVKFGVEKANDAQLPK